MVAKTVLYLDYWKNYTETAERLPGVYDPEGLDFLTDGAKADQTLQELERINDQMLKQKEKDDWKAAVDRLYEGDEESSDLTGYAATYRRPTYRGYGYS